MGDVSVTCPDCEGRRFDDDTLTVRYRGHTALDVLRMSVDEAAALFGDQPSIRRILGAMQFVGLGYLPLGQPSTTVSGGEAQRIKLASELGRPTTGHTLLILDEPTRGLHLADVDLLLGALDQLVQRGNSVVVVEPDPAVIRAADWVVDLGPDGGDGGGELVAAGTPEAIEAEPRSLTGAVLRGEMGTTPGPSPSAVIASAPIQLHGVTTHNLRDLDDHRGACESCDGLGTMTSTDPTRLVTDPTASLLDGALDGTKTGRWFTLTSNGGRCEVCSGTLSVGERQRIKLSRHLARAGKSSTLLLLDEPTTCRVRRGSAAR